jgi:hypothetical protein
VPALVNNRSLRTRNEAQIRDLIKSGTSFSSALRASEHCD